MKEQIIRSKRNPELLIQIFNDNELALLCSETQKEFSADNDEYLFEVYKLLKVANVAGCFKRYQEEGGDREKTEIYI